MSVGFAEVVAIMIATAFAQTNVAPPAVPTAPPSAQAKRSAADLEKLVAPIALYPDPLIATLLPASAYPLEVVQAARFVKDTNNIAKLDAQPWDPNVKEVAHFPDVIAQMSDNIEWMNDLGDAFVNQPKELMDAVQTMRSKAQASGSLKTTPEQVVVVTNSFTTNVVEQKTVIVTNQVVQIQPAQPEVIYVPQYNPTVVYAGYPVAYPGYYYPPASSVAAASVVSFGVGIAVGAIAANNCDWHGGGVYVGPRGGVWAGGGGHGDVDVDVNRNTTVNRNVNNANVQNRNTQAQGQKWQPDQSRLKNSGSPSSSAQSREARGWSSPSGQTAAGSARPGTGATGGQGGTSAGQARSTTPNTASRPSTTPNANRSASQPASTSRDAGGASASQASAFSSMQSGAADRSASQRGSTSRGSGGGGARAGGGGGARGGGGRR